MGNKTTTISKKCSVKGCYASCETGDSLFCPDDRKAWRKWCKETGMEYDSPCNNYIVERIKEFQKRF